MEAITTNAFKGITRYWKRKGYERLNGQPSRRQRIKYRPVELAQMGSSSSNHRKRRRLWRWRIRLSPKIRFGSRRKWLTKLRDAYVKLTLSFANGSGRFGAVDYGTASFDKSVVKEYDEKMIVEIYKSFVMGP